MSLESSVLPALGAAAAMAAGARVLHVGTESALHEKEDRELLWALCSEAFTTTEPADCNRSTSSAAI